MNPELMAYAAEALSTIPGGLAAPPPSAPAPGQSREDWVAEVARVRSEHDGQARVLVAHLTPPGPDVASTVDHQVPVDGGTITARVYTPEGDGPFPALVFFHGGAFWLGGGESGLAMTDDYCRAFAVRTGSVVVSVDYRLAPECPFPQQPEDCYAGLRWTVDHADDLRVDADDVTVMGASSGANQAAAVTLLARERGGPAIRAQVLHVPVLDLTWGSDSVRHDPMFAAFTDLVRLYADDQQRTDPLASPLLVADPDTLPPTLVVTGEYDGLRDDGRRYVDKLTAAGVDATLLEYPMMHSIALPATTEQMIAEMSAEIRRLQGR